MNCHPGVQGINSSDLYSLFKISIGILVAIEWHKGEITNEKTFCLVSDWLNALVRSGDKKMCFADTTRVKMCLKVLQFGSLDPVIVKMLSQGTTTFIQQPGTNYSF